MGRSGIQAAIMPPIKKVYKKLLLISECIMKYLITLLCTTILICSVVRHVFAAEHSSAGRSGGAAHEHSAGRTQEHAEHTEHVEHENHQASIEDAVNARIG